MKALVFSIFLATTASIASAQDRTVNRTFMFVGTPNGSAWEMLIASPVDREATVRGSIEKLGGELLSYHFGLGDGKNYILVSLPDDPTFIQAFYLSRMGDGLLNEYQMIEMMSSSDMAVALERVSEVKAAEGVE